jgi:hypothetical protein
MLHRIDRAVQGDLRSLLSQEARGEASGTFLEEVADYH